MNLITREVFDMVVKYPWEDKVVLALLAFALKYWEFFHPLQLLATNPIAKYVVQLKQLLHVSEREPLISTLLNVVIDVVKSINKLNDLPSEYISRDKPPFSEAPIPTAVCLAIQGIVACSSQSIGLVNIDHQ